MLWKCQIDFADQGVLISGNNDEEGLIGLRGDFGHVIMSRTRLGLISQMPGFLNVYYIFFSINV